MLFLKCCLIHVTGALDVRPMKKRESVISTAATMRVLNVLKHWVSKHQQVREMLPWQPKAITWLSPSVIDYLPFYAPCVLLMQLTILLVVFDTCWSSHGPLVCCSLIVCALYLSSLVLVLRSCVHSLICDCSAHPLRIISYAVHNVYVLCGTKI